MKLQFKNQAFQEAATAAVCDVFEGQPYHDPNVYTVDPGTGGHRAGVTLPIQGTLFGGELQQATLELPDDPPDVGYKNAEIELPLDVLRKNLHAVQDRQNLEHSKGGALGERALPGGDSAAASMGCDRPARFRPRRNLISRCGKGGVRALPQGRLGGGPRGDRPTVAVWGDAMRQGRKAPRGAAAAQALRRTCSNSLRPAQTPRDGPASTAHRGTAGRAS